LPLVPEEAGSGPLFCCLLFWRLSSMATQKTPTGLNQIGVFGHLPQEIFSAAIIP
jgi:hypothetical protein